MARLMKCTNNCYDSKRLTWLNDDEIVRCQCCSVRLNISDIPYCALCANALLEELTKNLGIEYTK